MRADQKPWTREDECLLELYYPTAALADLVEVLGRTVKALRSRARILKLWRRELPLSPAEIRSIRERYANESCRAIAESLGRKMSTIFNFACKHKLKKSPEYMRTIGFQKGTKTGASYQFPKGHEPANKGLRRPGYAPGRMAETQFKKGDRLGAAQHNYKPVGTIYQDSSGLPIIKVYDAKCAADRYGIGDGKSWEYLHRKVWREHNGPIPKGFHVAFKNGDRGNVSIENLELVSFAEMMRRNTIHNLPQPLKEVIQLNGRLKRRIRKMSHVQENYYQRSA